MPHYRMGFGGDYISAEEFGGKEPTVLIESVTLESVAVTDEDDVPDAPTKYRKRWIVRFAGKERGWLLNLTNAQLLIGMFNSDKTEGWIGHRVTLCSAQVKFGKVTVPGIRIKGSPELTAPIRVDVKLPRRRPVTMTMVPTGKKGTEDAGD